MFLCVWARDTLKHRVGPLCVHGIFLGDKGIHTASLAVCFPHSTQPLFLFLHNKQVRLLLPCCVKDRTPMFTFTRFCTLQNCSFVPFCVGLLSSQTELRTKDAKEMLPMFLTGSSFRIASPTTALQTLLSAAAHLSLEQICARRMLNIHCFRVGDCAHTALPIFALHPSSAATEMREERVPIHLDVGPRSFH